MKEHYAHIALLGAGAIALLWYLVKSGAASSTASNGSAIPDAAVAPAPGYPNSTPIQMGDITIGGSPTNLTYNTFEAGSNPYSTENAVELGASADSAGSGGACCTDPCSPLPGQPVTKQKVPAAVYGAALENFSTFSVKTGGVAPVGGAVPLGAGGGGGLAATSGAVAPEDAVAL